VEATKVPEQVPELERAGISEDASQGEKSPAWELVEAGRYRPRRIRGSLLGRELG
jgi:hypothetical protein